MLTSDRSLKKLWQNISFCYCSRWDMGVCYITFCFSFFQYWIFFSHDEHACALTEVRHGVGSIRCQPVIRRCAWFCLVPQCRHGPWHSSAHGKCLLHKVYMGCSVGFLTVSCLLRGAWPHPAVWWPLGTCLLAKWSPPGPTAPHQTWTCPSPSELLMAYCRE